MSNWRPVHADHAIEAMAIMLFFSSDIPPLVMQKVRDRAELAAKEIGLTEQRPLFELEVPADGSGTPIQTEAGRVFLSLEGLSESQVTAGQFRELLSIEKNSLGYRNATYSNWTETKDRFFKLINEILPILREVMAISRLRIEYSDRFIWEGEWTEGATAQLIRPESKYVAPHVYSAPELWHSHTGAALPTTTPGRAKILQVHLQSGQWRHQGDPNAQPQTGVVLMTGREDRFEFDDVAMSSQTYNMLFDDLDEMHSDLLAAISAVIGNDMLLRIGLEATGK